MVMKRQQINIPLDKYFELGGTGKGLATSLSSLSPIHGLDKFELAMFYEWLNDDEKKVLEKAINYYAGLLQN